MATKKINKTSVVIIRVPDGLKDVLQKGAEKDRRTLSDFIRIKLMDLTNYKPKKK